jgi:carbonic anhydrase
MTDLSRRRALRAFGLGASAAALMPAVGARAEDAAHAAATPLAGPGLTPAEALQLLKDGNAEFLHDRPFHAATGAARRLEIAKAQHPFAILVGCSDSRVPPELLFGRGLGELFIVRVAGNTVDRTALGSIEYAVEHLGVPLIVVLGHERCGAVAAACSVVKEGAVFPGAIGEMVEPIVPAVLSIANRDGDLVDNAVRANVRRVVSRLLSSGEIVETAVHEGRLLVVGARYDLDDGYVDFFSDV